jgi:hypothetical protein
MCSLLPWYTEFPVYLLLLWNIGKEERVLTYGNAHSKYFSDGLQPNPLQMKVEVHPKSDYQLFENHLKISLPHRFVAGMCK